MDRTLHRSALGVATGAVALATSVAVGDVVLHVDASAPPGGDGLTWASAFDHLQDALSAVADIGATEIRIGPGLHRPDRSAASPSGTGDRFAAFEIPDGLVLRGGFAGLGAGDPDEWDPWTHETILCGDLLGDDDAPGGGIDDNSINVVRIRSHGSLVAGVTITRGNADTVVPGGTYAGGGGISAEQASFALLAVRLVGNSRSALMSTVCSFTVDDSRLIGNSTFGSGLHILSGSTATVRDTLFQDNVGSSIRVSCANVVIERCDFIGNVASSGGAGGAIYNACVLSGLSGLLEVRHCRFIGNGAGGPGGAIQSGTSMTIWIGDSLFAGNASGVGGGAVLMPRNGNRVVNSVFVGNTAGLGGGGLFMSPSPSFSTAAADIVGCHFVGNAQTGTLPAGGGLYLTSNARVINCVIGNNFSATNGGGVGLTGSQSANPHRILAHVTVSGNVPDGVAQPEGGSAWTPITHSIVWGNGGAPLSIDPESPVRHSIVEGGWAGAGFGNLDTDPLLVAPDGGDFRLGEGSPAIDAGLVSLLPTEPFDLDGDGVLGPLPIDIVGAPRVQGDAPDLGAHEGWGTPLVPMASAAAIAPGAEAMLVPVNEAPWAGQPVVAEVLNLAERPIAATVAEVGWAKHPVTVGYSEDGLIAELAVAAPPGSHRTRVRIPIGLAHVPTGLLVSHLRATVWDATNGRWRLAPALNTGPSPGHSGPIGDFHVQYGAIGAPTLSPSLGDHGVFWDPIVKVGFVWANVDVSGDFGVGTRLCPADLGSALGPHDGDGVVDGYDLGMLLAAWGSSIEADLTGDGVVDAADLAVLIAAWGACDIHDDKGGLAGDGPGSPGDGGWRGPALPDADLNGDGVVDGADLGILLAAWSVAGTGLESPMRNGHPADLNGDGVVDGADLGLLLLMWDASTRR